MGRRRKHHSGSRLASDQIPGQNQNNICLRPCRFLWYHHQAFRDDTRVTLYSLAPSIASDNPITCEICDQCTTSGTGEMDRSIVSGISQRVRFGVQWSENLELRISNPPPSSLSRSGIPNVQAIYVSSLDLFLLRWLLLDIENVLLEPVARRQDDLPPFPPTPGPQSKTISKRDNW